MNLQPNPSDSPTTFHFLRDCLREQASPFNLGEWYVIYDRIDRNFNSVELEIGFRNYPELAYTEMIDRDLVILGDYFEVIAKFASAWGDLFRNFYTEPDSSHIYLGEN